MKEEQNIQDPYLGFQPIVNYYLREYSDEGKMGKIYKAVRIDPHDILACKVIPAEKLKKGWERELEKIVLLRGVP